jgi:Zn-dependent peptidase ImmA (M78 family)
VASFRENVDRLLKARRLSEMDLGIRIGRSKTDLTKILDDPPKRKGSIVKDIATELVVPDFYLFSDELAPSETIADFRLTNPRARGYQRATIKAIEFARQVQLDASSRLGLKNANALSLQFANTRDPSEAAEILRKRIGLTDDDQIGFETPRLFFAYLRREIERYDTFVFQITFPTEDGVGFAIAKPKSFDAIVLNTSKQAIPRRLFTLAHEVYHCIINESGISDPNIINNDVEQRCNRFAAEFLAPTSLVKKIARQTLKSNDFQIDDLKKFAGSIKLSMAASLFRLVETGHYKSRAIGAWQAFLRNNGDPDFLGGGGGRRQEEWKYKLSKYGTRFAELYSSAVASGGIDEYEFYRLSGIKPKYQHDYFEFAPKASLHDAEDEADA